MDAAGTFKNKGSGTKSIQGENKIGGSMQEVFEDFTSGMRSTPGGAKIHPDGRIISKHKSKNGPTISVFEKGQLQKKLGLPMNKINYKREDQNIIFTNDLYFIITKFTVNTHVSLQDILMLPQLEEEILEEHIRNDSSGLYLRSAFKVDKLEDYHFRYHKDKESLLDYFDSISTDEDWPSFNDAFRLSVKKLFSLDYTDCLRESYSLNKDDFTSDSEITVEREFRAYGFYLLIIWMCNEKNSFYVCTWGDE